MNESHTPTRAEIDAFRVDWFAKAYLESPLAQTRFDLGEPLEFFVPMTSADGSDWVGVDITIAGVSRSQAVAGSREKRRPLRGNGYSQQLGRPLRPGDFGVHSHPATGSLLPHKPAAE